MHRLFGIVLILAATVAAALTLAGFWLHRVLYGWSLAAELAFALAVVATVAVALTALALALRRPDDQRRPIVAIAVALILLAGFLPEAVDRIAAP